MTELAPYAGTLLVAGLTGLLIIIQMLVADVLAIRAKHPPGHVVPPDHGDVLFRATRAHANTNESVAAFILLAAFGIASGAAPAWINGLAWVYFAGRLGHMVFYYADLRMARSVAFAVAVLGLGGLFVAGAVAWI